MPFKSAHVDRVRFVLPNFVNYLGQTVLVAPTSSSAGRAEFTSGQWKVVIDPHNQTDEFFTALRLTGGYALTHTGEVSKVDGSSFSQDECEDLLLGLGNFLSFARGAWVMPQLPHGYVKGRLAWRHWRLRNTWSWTGNFRWLTEVHGGQTIETAAPLFLAMWSNLNWRDQLARAVYFYIHANDKPSDTGLVMAQTTLELLAWAVLVNDRAALTLDGFSRLSAADQIRLLLSVSSIPAAIPGALPGLGAYRISGRRPFDGPEAIVHIRNQTVHPSKPGTTKPHSDQVLDAWKLATWYAELILLTIIGYSGPYESRIDLAVTKTPW